MRIVAVVVRSGGSTGSSLHGAGAGLHVSRVRFAGRRNISKESQFCGRCRPVLLRGAPFSVVLWGRHGGGVGAAAALRVKQRCQCEYCGTSMDSSGASTSIAVLLHVAVLV